MAPPQSQSQSSCRKTPKGRKKIEMKLVENESARESTFSKRKAGIFKKATDLATLCGAQICIIIFSMGGRPHSFGHPSIGHVLSLFCRDFSLLDLSTNNGTRPDGETTVEKMRSFPDNISDGKLYELNLVELKKMKQKMESIRHKIRREINRIELDATHENPNSENINLGKVEMNESDASHWLKL